MTLRHIRTRIWLVDAGVLLALAVIVGVVSTIQSGGHGIPGAQGGDVTFWAIFFASTTLAVWLFVSLCYTTTELMVGRSPAAIALSSGHRLGFTRRLMRWSKLNGPLLFWGTLYSMAPLSTLSKGQLLVLVASFALSVWTHLAGPGSCSKCCII